jgi:hypothetical protein
VRAESGKELELVPGGADRAVSDLNKSEYIFRFVDYKVHGQFEHCVRPLLAGFNRVFPNELLKIFDEEELARVLNGGRAEIDLGDLRKNTEYRAGYAAKDAYIKVRDPHQDFWNVLATFSPEEKKALLRFVTCNERPPVLGFAELHPRFTIQRPETSSDDRLPEAATCFNTLRLPRYTSAAVLKQKLLYAIKHNKGFYNL